MCVTKATITSSKLERSDTRNQNRNNQPINLFLILKQPHLQRNWVPGICNLRVWAHKSLAPSGNLHRMKIIFTGFSRNLEKIQYISHSGTVPMAQLETRDYCAFTYGCQPIFSQLTPCRYFASAESSLRYYDRSRGERLIVFRTLFSPQSPAFPPSNKWFCGSLCGDSTIVSNKNGPTNVTNSLNAICHQFWSGSYHKTTFIEIRLQFFAI